ncbi:MAG: YbjN domain-containing protein [Paracoccaceae bacterium]
MPAYRLPALAPFFLAAAFAAPAPAQTLVAADNPAKILEIARGFGSAELETDSEGAPVIRGRIEGTRYSVFFFGCEDGKDCTDIQFWSYLPAPQDALGAVNDWNRERRFGKAYVDSEGDIAIEFDVNLWGGVSPKNLDDTFDWWRVVLERAGEVFGTPPPPAEAPPASPAHGTDNKTL